nr:MarR family transcriptional regulator [Microvirga solisilvae]
MSSPCHCTRLRMVTRKISALYDAALASEGINVAQFAMLRNIARSQPISLTDLARRLELDRSTMGRNVRVIEKMGLVEMGKGEDQREAVVKLTTAGEVLLARALPLWEACQDDMAKRLGQDRLDTIGELLSLL